MKIIVALSSKGQLTLPASVRKALGLEKGDRLEVSVDESHRSITVSPIVDIEQLSTRISAYANRAYAKRGYEKQRVPVTDVDEYYQTHRNGRGTS